LKLRRNSFTDPMQATPSRTAAPRSDRKVN
jgi:hypothetical protein